MSGVTFVILSFEGPDPYSYAGGLGSRVTELAEALAATGFETHLFFVGDPHLPGQESREEGRLVLHRWCQWISHYHPHGVYDGSITRFLRGCPAGTATIGAEDVSPDDSLTGSAISPFGKHNQNACSTESGNAPVYDGEEEKLLDWEASLPGWLERELLEPQLAAGGQVVVLGKSGTPAVQFFPWGAFYPKGAGRARRTFSGMPTTPFHFTAWTGKA